MPNLVGIGLSQVPTNSMLGGMAYQDPEHASIKDLDLKNLSQINSEIADTTKDVFVYDTRKDSDGGAWRKRTQNTSWYNEPLGTRYRGNRREFPAVAVIVGVLHGIKIYDGDDPDLPLWAYYKRLSWDRDVNSIAARDGKICFTIHTNDAYSGNGFGILDYVKDRQSRNYIGGYSNFKNGFVNDLIASKRETNTYLTLGTNIREFTLIDYNAQDVAMTVLPNAPIDSATGLPVPTIAVGTNGGASIIKDDGNVVDITITTGSNNDADRVDFTDDNRVVIQWGGDSAGEITIDEIQSADISANYPINLPGSHYNDNSPASYSPCFLTEGPSLSNRHPTAIQQFRAVGTSAALSVFEENKESEEDGMVSFISSSYNTGYQQGRIKGAFLSDTDTTNIVATEMVTNGTFASDTAGWSVLNTGTFTASGGQATLSDSDGTGTSPVAYQQISGFVVGRTYVLSYDTTASREAYAYMSHTAGSNNQNMYVQGYSGSRTGTQTVTFVANATSMIVNFSDGSGSDFNITVDNVSIKLGDKDRSLNNKGLIAYGTITKSAVATGAELVGYSGFLLPSASSLSVTNALIQPYNTSISGTQFVFSGWFKTNSNSDYQYTVQISDTSTNQTVGGLSIYNTGTGSAGFPYMWSATGSSSGESGVFSGPRIDDNVWHHFVAIFDNTDKRLYVDGISRGSKPISGTITTPFTGAEVYIGMHRQVKTSGDNQYRHYLRGSVALIRIGTSIPSPEQIKKMYEDEKCLFHENAKATLYGSSDAVTALAYDDTTNLLHVGTSAGRSEFQGLRRCCIIYPA